MSVRHHQAEGADLVLAVGDITAEATDGIVNAANPAMLGGGGVDGAIHRAAGPALLAACRTVERRDEVRCPPGEARITPGFQLPAPWVIHTVGPVFEDDATSEPILRMAYRSCLALARDHGLRSLAFPAISCGVYGYPRAAAARVALSTCRDHGHNLMEIRFVLFSEAMYNVWAEVARDLFA